ncbi:MAG: GNAT family N-acetyltransferase [Gaiellaceae bacterium]
MKIRPETEADYDAVAELTAAAFGKGDEARLVEAIRGSKEYVPELTLVAEENGRIVGHVMYSYSELGGSDTRLLQLSPLSVAPDRQRAGIGSALTRKSLRLADERREPLVLVLGHPTYYPRFGFRPASTLGLEAPNPEWPDDAFMAVPLTTYDPALRGRVRFAPAFD